jgi:hypothetical protein
MCIPVHSWWMDPLTTTSKSNPFAQQTVPCTFPGAHLLWVKQAIQVTQWVQYLCQHRVLPGIGHMEGGAPIAIQAVPGVT